MADDIVTRLHDLQFDGTVEMREVSVEAADEIERLRKENTRLAIRIGHHMDIKDELRSSLGQTTHERDTWKSIAVKAYAWEYSDPEQTAQFDYDMAVRDERETRNKEARHD